jgi:Cd2+/Zn2+-exporting ATPase
MRQRKDESDDFIFFDNSNDEVSVEPVSTSCADDCCAEEDASTSVSLDIKHSSVTKTNLTKSSFFEEDTNSAEIVTDGIHDFEWQIRGMDCPDCAMKATSAMSKNIAVTSCEITHADGLVRLSIDLGKGDLFKVNHILTSLGYEPDVPWMRLRGVTVESVLERQKCDIKSLKRLMQSALGILNAKLDGDSILIQTPNSLAPSYRSELELSLERITGSKLNLIEGEVSGLSITHQRLIGASFALFILPLVIILEAVAAPTIIIASLGISGVVVGGFRMFKEAVASIRNRVLGFQILTSMAVIGAAVLQHWPEALMVVLLESVSGHLESSALLRAREAMQGGLDRLPQQARVVSLGQVKTEDVSSTTFSVSHSPSSTLDPSHPEPHKVPIDLVQLGNLVEVRSGELIPVDGFVAEGIGQIDRAPMTGESVPIRIELGDFVEAGLVLIRGPVLIEVSAVGNDTKLSGLIEKVHTYRDQPPRLQSSVESFTKYWVPTVLIAGGAVGLFFGDIMMMLLLWVVACPCALLLAAPIPHATALSNAAHYGIIARGGDVLERTARVDLALLDKTGTLTSGHPCLDSVVLSDGIEMDEVLSLAAGLEQRSNHPYAATILVAASSQEVSPLKVTSILDEVAGVSGKVGRSKVRFGTENWLIDEGITIPKPLTLAAADARVKGFGLSLLSKSKVALALFIFNNDDLRDGAINLISDLKELGISVELLSGDSQSAVEALGDKLGIEDTYCRGGIDPDGKAIWVQRRSQALCTLMAGDGFNDAAALASADVGVAVGSGESVNLEAADVLIPSSDPQILSRLIRLSRKAKKIVQINLIISFIVTILLVISVVDEWHSSLTIGVFVHEASALVIILNGIWLADKGMSRFGILGTLFKQLGADCIEAWKSLKALMLASN